MKNSVRLRHTPDADHIYWLYSPEGDGLTFWKSQEDRDAYAKREIATYLDDCEWFEEVEGVIAGVVTHQATAVNIKKAVGALDEDGYDEAGEGPFQEEGQSMCDYELLPIRP